jgi:hypothetical protein
MACETKEEASTQKTEIDSWQYFEASQRGWDGSKVLLRSHFPLVGEKQAARTVRYRMFG